MQQVPDQASDIVRLSLKRERERKRLWLKQGSRWEPIPKVVLWPSDEHRGAQTHKSYIIQRFLNFYYICLLGWVVHVPQLMCGGQRIFLEVSSLLPGIELKFSCLMTSAFNHWAIFLAPNQKENNGFLDLGSMDSFALWPFSRAHTGLWKSRPEGQEFPHRKELCVAAYSRRCLWLWNHGSFSGRMTFSSGALREPLWQQPLWGGGFDVGSSWWWFNLMH